LAINRASSLADALQEVAKALSMEVVTLKDPVEITYRKLTRIVSSLSETMALADVPTGAGFGRAFTNLVSQAGGTKGAEAARLRDEAAISTLSLVVQILRLRFDALLDAEFYRAVGIVRGWWRPGRPSSKVEETTDRIAKLAVEGLHILARQGIADQVLRQSLMSALGADRVNRVGSALAAKDPSLDPQMSAWLATGRSLPQVRKIESFQEMADLESDVLLAKLMIVLDTREGGPQALMSVAESMEILDPSNAAAVRAGAVRSRAIDQWGQALASKRRLSLYGHRGEIVKFDPALHDPLNEIARSSLARVELPGVKKQIEGRPATIIAKAQVRGAGEE
jgi:hypothetical protein